MSFGTSLRNRRRQLGLSQEELAQSAQVDVKTVRSLEHDRTTPRPSTVRQLADALGLADADREHFCATVAPEPAEPSPDATPAQLPVGVRGFTGRSAHLAALDAINAAGGQQSATIIAAIDGPPGVGKTSLAVHWAHQVADHFGDGQLYVNLRGFAPTSTPMTPAEAIRAFLDALHVPAHRIPAGLDAQAALYRSLLSGKRMLVLLDNARDADQIRPLLPGAPSCLVVVTSRTRLTGLVAAEGAHPMTLDPLHADEARTLLTDRIGAHRVSAEPESVKAIIAACGRLPLALAVAAALAATRPHLPLHHLAAELDDTTGLDTLTADDDATDVRAVFSWSYQALSTGAARLFRLLGLHPGPDIGVAATAGLVGLSARQTRLLLADLVRANLVVEHQSGRFTMHDLLRAYARELTLDVDTDAQRRAATLRMLDHYLHTGHAAALLMDATRTPLPLGPPAPAVTPERLVDLQQASAWFTAELAVLLAVIDHSGGTEFDTHTWQLAWTPSTFLGRQGRWRDQIVVGEVALAAARRLDDPAKQALTHRFLSRAHVSMGALDHGNTHLGRALDLFTRIGDRSGQADAHRAFTLSFERRGLHREALDHARQALELYTETGNRLGQAHALNLVGWYGSLLGDHERALTVCHQALLLLQEVDDPEGEAGAWDSLGHAHHHLGHHGDAVACYRRSLALVREIHSRAYEATVLTNLGDTHHASGDVESARAAWQEAYSILVELDHPDADALNAKLARQSC